MSKRPFLDAFEATDVLMLKPAPNGGWVVGADKGDPGARPRTVGAFTDAQDMIDALSSALLPEDGNLS